MSIDPEGMAAWKLDHAWMGDPMSRKVEIVVLSDGRIAVDTYWDSGIRSMHLSGHTFTTGWVHILSFLRQELRDDVAIYIHIGV